MKTIILILLLTGILFFLVKKKKKPSKKPQSILDFTSTNIESEIKNDTNLTEYYYCAYLVSCPTCEFIGEVIVNSKSPKQIGLYYNGPGVNVFLHSQISSGLAEFSIIGLGVSDCNQICII